MNVMGCPSAGRLAGPLKPSLAARDGRSQRGEGRPLAPPRAGR